MQPAAQESLRKIIWQLWKRCVPARYRLLTGDRSCCLSSIDNPDDSGKTGVEKRKDSYRLLVENTAKATELILKYPQVFVDYEITNGKMDDVFLAVTGKILKEDSKND